MGLGEAEEAIYYAVFQSGHPPHLRFKRIQRTPKRRKHQPTGILPLVALQPGHGAPQHKRLRLKTLLRRPFDVGRLRSIFQLLVVAQAASHDVVAVRDTERLELLVVMQPLLIRQKARTIHAGTLALHKRGGFCGFTFGVFGAVFIAGQVMGVALVDRAVAEDRLPAGFDDRFVRLWRFYLMYCEGGFRGGLIDVGQVTLIKPA